MENFPSGIAEGAAFCNRVQERTRLINNIKHIKHTVLMAPRRYGKTSLIRQVILENNCIYVWVDFLSVTSKEEIEEKLLKASKDLLLKLATELKKIQLQARNLIQSMSPELNLSAMGQSLSLQLNSDNSVSIDELLVKLDEYAQKVDKTAVLVFDEFQQISQIQQSEAVEALIRHAVERSKALTYVFSGSNRHILGEMFSRHDRPLYRLCQVMPIDRIATDDYKLFLNKAALNRWGTDLSNDVFQTIMDLSAAHPFYVNALCSEVWMEEVAPITKDSVEKTWSWYVDTHKSVIIADVIALPLNQRKIITTLAHANTAEPYGSEFCMRIKLSASSIRQAMETLLRKDMVYIDPHGRYSLLDPAIEYYIKKH